MERQRPSAYGSILDRVLAAGATGPPPQAVSHLVGLSTSDSPLALRHATKVTPTSTVDPGRWANYLNDLASAAAPHPLIRWLVWLGSAAPPDAPSHLRVTTDGGPFAGVIVPLAGSGEPLRIQPVPRGAAIVSGTGALAWREIQEHSGRVLPVPQLRLAGLRAEPHHRQVLPATREELRVVLVRPEPGAVVPS